MLRYAMRYIAFSEHLSVPSLFAEINQSNFETDYIFSLHHHRLSVQATYSSTPIFTRFPMYALPVLGYINICGDCEAVILIWF